MSMLKEFVVTTYVRENDKFLLVHHPKSGKWLPPGGHLEENERPPDCARREVLEETGYTIELISDDTHWVETALATSFERPFMCQQELVPAFGNTPEHIHLDLIYLGRVDWEVARIKPLDAHEMRWMTLEDIEAIDAKLFFPDTLITLKHLFFQEILV